MVSRSSWQKSSITSRESTSVPEDTCDLVREGDLRRVECVARILQRLRGARRRRRARAVEEGKQLLDRPGSRGSPAPTTTNGGSKKSSTPEPSRRNSGHMAMPTVHPAGSSSGGVNAGSTTECPVPGGTVDRMTTAWKPRGRRGRVGHRLAQVAGPERCSRGWCHREAWTGCRRTRGRPRPPRSPPGPRGGGAHAFPRRPPGRQGGRRPARRPGSLPGRWRRPCSVPRRPPTTSCPCEARPAAVTVPT